MTDSLKSKVVLVVDDDERNRFALSTYLNTYDIEVHTARDGQEAIKVLQNGNDIHLILLDIMMPTMDGYETLKVLRADDHFKHIPVIAVTAKAMVGDKERCLEAGAWDYIPKPIDLKTFLNKIQTLIL
jgi:CheY-like chemotaxis protein